MITESAQILSTVVRESGPNFGYKPTHKSHPCTKWAAESLSNWLWLNELGCKLFEEYSFRYDKYSHKSHDIICSLPEPKIKDIGLTTFALAIPYEYKTNCTVESYRSYYKNEKQHLHTWKLRGKPEWL